MKLPVFGSKELCKCLISLKFTPLEQKGTSHLKYKPPKNRTVQVGQKSFIIVQMGRKEYDPHARTRYIRQIINFGFKKEEVIRNIR